MMQTQLTIGQCLHGFKILAVENLEELAAIGIWARHERTGTEVFHLYTDDEENLFAFAFATPPENSTGVAHILEHSVLCGSRRYPLKDTFVVLAQGSLQTFLNAMTFPDKTVYPASSTNRQDYFNLMAVYGDAVFHPLLEEWTFLQEGHRIELVSSSHPAVFPATSADTSGTSGTAVEQLIRTGVVYNEMKGNYSSADAIASDWVFRAVLQGTPYGFDSGGDPDEIPSLSWQELQDFHRRYYHPANCRIFLYGNIPTAEQLAFLHEHFFGQWEDKSKGLSALGPAGSIPMVSYPRAPRWERPRRMSVPYPASSGDAKSIVLLSWLVGDSTNREETLALGVLTEILLGHDGSPLTKALIESHVGEDIAPGTGLETDLRETVFAAGLRGVAPHRAQEVERLVLDTLEKLVNEGIPPEEIEAALFSMEFSHREIRRSSGPFSLVLMRRSLRGWLHGTAPWETLQFTEPFTALKTHLSQDPRYFEHLVVRVLLNNPHRVLLSIDPDVGLAQRKAEAEARDLAAQYQRLSPDERQALVEKNALIRSKQSEADDPALLARIPHLSRTDLSTEVEKIARTVDAIGPVPLVLHTVPTNGITYGDLAIPVDILDAEEYDLLPFLSRCIPALGLPGESYARVSSRMARLLGGFSAFLHTASASPGSAKVVATPVGTLDIVGRDWIVFRFKTLHEKLSAALPLVFDLLTAADFSDHARLQDVLLEYRNDLVSSLVQSGHSFALAAASHSFSRSRFVEDRWYGIPQIEYVQRMVQKDIAELAKTLQKVRDKLMSQAGIVLHITTEEAYQGRALQMFSPLVKRWKAPGPRREPFSSEVWEPRKNGMPLVIFQVPPLQIGFVAQAFPAAPFASVDHSTELVLAHHLSTGPLWEEIRMKGGAYGAFAFPDGLEPVFCMATYRDPHVERSVRALGAILQQTGQQPLTEEQLEKIIIGAYAKETRPKTNPEKGLTDFLRFLTGITDWQRQQKVRYLLSCTAKRLCEKATTFATAAVSQGGLSSPRVVIAGVGPAQQLEREYGVSSTILSV